MLARLISIQPTVLVGSGQQVIGESLCPLLAVSSTGRCNAILDQGGRCHETKNSHLLHAITPVHQFPHQRANGHHFRFTPQAHLIVNITHLLIIDFSAQGGHVKGVSLDIENYSTLRLFWGLMLSRTKSHVRRKNPSEKSINPNACVLCAVFRFKRRHF